MNRKPLMWIFLFILLVLPVMGAGVCSLDKLEYHPGETALLSCICTSPQEEGVFGEIVWVNDTSILQTTVVNSGSCRTSFFGATYTFLSGQNFLGNATFNTTDPQWNSDVVTDDFNVSGASIVDCELQQATFRNNTNLGTTLGGFFYVVDAITNAAIVHASCSVEISTMGGTPITIIKSGSAGSDTFLTSVAEGHVGFIHKLDEKLWETNKVYLARMLCFTLNSTFDGDHAAFNQVTGDVVGTKTCGAQALISTGDKDFRTFGTDSSSSVSVVIFILVIALGLFFLPSLISRFHSNMFADLVIKRGIYAIAIYLMMFNSSILMHISQVNGLGLNDEMFRYLWFFGIAGWVSLLYLVIKTLLDLKDLIVQEQERLQFNE